MKQQALPLQFNLNLQASPVSNKREQGLLIGLLSGMSSDFYTNCLKTGVSRNRLLEILASNPRFKNESSIAEMLYFLQNEGDRSAYAILLPHLSTSAEKEELTEKIQKNLFGIELFVRRAQNLHRLLTLIKQESWLHIEEEELQRGILAWDMGSLVSLARIAYETQNITEQKAWEYIEFAGEQCRNSFKNWEETGKSFLLGQAMETENETELKQVIANFRFAIENKESPWRE